jgi:hypothetical protein
MFEIPEGFVQTGVHGKGGGVDSTALRAELEAQGATVLENSSHLIWGMLKH